MDLQKSFFYSIVRRKKNVLIQGFCLL
jgi:hypothetical protein